MRSLVVLSALVLMACSTPQQRCVSPISSQLETINALIVETERNIVRGYSYVNEPSNLRVGINYCAGSYSSFRFCGSTYNDLNRRPVAVDVAAEQRKLEDLRNQQAALQKALPKAQAVCAEQYPG